MQVRGRENARKVSEVRRSEKALGGLSMGVSAPPSSAGVAALPPAPAASRYSPERSSCGVSGLSSGEGDPGSGRVAAARRRRRSGAQHAP